MLSVYQTDLKLSLNFWPTHACSSNVSFTFVPLSCRKFCRPTVEWICYERQMKMSKHNRIMGAGVGPAESHSAMLDKQFSATSSVIRLFRDKCKLQYAKEEPNKKRWEIIYVSLLLSIRKRKSTNSRRSLNRGFACILQQEAMGNRQNRWLRRCEPSQLQYVPRKCRATVRPNHDQSSTVPPIFNQKAEICLNANPKCNGIWDQSICYGLKDQSTS